MMDDLLRDFECRRMWLDRHGVSRLRERLSVTQTEHRPPILSEIEREQGRLL
jgi:hypothetical protein